ncbi:MAG TPA: S53 family peptidase [Methylocella sp.]|nr:S53 family peptidase [Methylocella sp.]
MFLNAKRAFITILLMTSTALAQASGTPFASGVTLQDLKITPDRASAGGGHVVIPDSSLPKASDAGKRAHTNYRVFVPNALAQPRPLAAKPAVGPPYPGYFNETPASLACIYALVPVTPGCDPNTVTAVSSLGSRVIAIVDAYDDPSALDDLTVFSSQFGLPAPNASNFQVVYGTPGNVQPPTDPTFGWEGEEALDVEVAHAIAPNAKIILVEAASESNDDLLYAEDVASGLVAAANGGEVTNSWGEAEFPGQTALDTHFSTAKVVYFAAAGDSPGVIWPSSSTNVVAVGGTSVSRWLNGYFLWESSWLDGGGGVSAFVPRKTFQNGLISRIGVWRATPDIAAEANPDTGIWVTCGAGCGGSLGDWYIYGGTSVASPLIAAMVNDAGHFATSTNAELLTIYANLGWPTRFNDVTHGVCGPYLAFPTTAGIAPSTAGWDFCTGVGSPNGLKGL